MARNTINIDGAKLREIIESRLDLNIYTIAEDNGYSRNLIAQAIRSGKASPVVQTLLRLYKVSPEEYEYKEPIEEIRDPEQITIDDITPLNREELKELIKEAVRDVLKEAR
jgi:hypothetical protein